MEDMYERAEFAKELGSVDHHDRPRDRLYGDPVDGEMGAPERHDPASPPRRPFDLHAAEDPRRLASASSPNGCGSPASTTSMPAPVVGKLEGDPATTRGYYDICREDFIPQQLEHGIFFDQHWASLNKLMPVASGGIHAGQMHQLLALFRRGRGAAVRRRHHRPSDGHRGGRHRQPGRARGDGASPATPAATRWPRVQTILDEAARSCSPLRQALDIWKDVTFNYASTDSPDFVPSVTPAE